jgi:hypothetical protein
VSVHKYHLVDKNRGGGLGENVRAMKELRNVLRGVQRKNEERSVLGLKRSKWKNNITMQLIIVK